MKCNPAEVERLQKEEMPPGVPIGQWALVWCLINLVATTLISGRKNPEQVKANARAAGLLTAD